MICYMWLEIWGKNGFIFLWEILRVLCWKHKFEGALITEVCLKYRIKKTQMISVYVITCISNWCCVWMQVRKGCRELLHILCRNLEKRSEMELSLCSYLAFLLIFMLNSVSCSGNFSVSLGGNMSPERDLDWVPILDFISETVCI